jgi:hypothetical protein
VTNRSLDLISVTTYLQKEPCECIETESSSSHEMTRRAHGLRSSRQLWHCCTVASRTPRFRGPMRAGCSVWACVAGICRAKLSSTSSASRKRKGASTAAAGAVPQTLPPPSHREPHRKLCPGHREMRGPAPLHHGLCTGELYTGHTRRLAQLRHATGCAWSISHPGRREHAGELPP